MDVCYRSSRTQIKLTRFLPPLKRVGFRAVTAVSEGEYTAAFANGDNPLDVGEDARSIAAPARVPSANAASGNANAPDTSYTFHAGS